MEIKEKENLLKSTIIPYLEKEGIEVFELKFFYSSGKPLLRILVDFPEGGITIDDCSLLNKKLSDYLEGQNFLEGSFVLEVSSPGVNRDLSTFKDFLRVKQKSVSLWLSQEFEGRLHYDGKVLDVDSDKKVLFLELDNNKSITLPLNFIKKGKERIIEMR
ncbi:MAG: hypothetical protein JW734_06385 [Candidatus Omnitrophica bacterium]|nr:hypothetical protein [Candidatus Omnitrophota bacterium]